MDIGPETTVPVQIITWPRGVNVRYMFSWKYVLRSIGVTLAYPSLVVSWLQRKDIRVEIHNRRLAEWARIKRRYADAPKKVLGSKMYLDPNDLTPISSSIGTSGFLDLPLTCLLTKVLKNSMTFVDVGANIGYYTLLGSKIVGNGGRVYAFEPETHNFRLLEKSVRENGRANISVYKLAISDIDGQVRLFRASKWQPGGHSISKDQGQGFEQVVSTTLDDFWEKNGKPSMDLIKIHVTGDDPLVIAGMGRILRESRPKIAMIFDPPKWRGRETLLALLFQLYDACEIIRSPFLLRRTTLQSLNQTEARELFLVPKAVTS
jgi:FkbM family methyltransferase